MGAARPLTCPKTKATAAATTSLWGDGKGAFETKGDNAAAAVRGTRWLVEDTCTTTTVRVARGIVSVLNLVTGRTVSVKAGHRYTARRPS